jgi:hypothetical protein
LRENHVVFTNWERNQQKWPFLVTRNVRGKYAISRSFFGSYWKMSKIMLTGNCEATRRLDGEWRRLDGASPRLPDGGRRLD